MKKIIIKQSEQVLLGVTLILNIKVKGIEKHYQLRKYINKYRPYLNNIINNLKNSDTWKIQLAVTINFISPKDDNDEDHVIHS